MSARTPRARRSFLGGAAATLLAGCGATKATRRSEASELRIGYVSPKTGPLSVFTASDNFLLKRVLPALDALPAGPAGRRIRHVVESEDSASTAAGAAAAARKLIDRHKPHLMVVGFTPDTTNPVTLECEKAGIPLISSLAPNTPWKTTGPHRSSFHFFWDLDDILGVFTGMWKKVPTNKVAAGLWPDDPDGAAFAAAFTDALRKDGWTVVDTGRYANGTTDFSDAIRAWKKAGVEVLTGVPIPPDFARCWAQCAELGFRPKVASIAKAILFPQAIDGLGGELPNGLSSEVWWSPMHPFRSALTGKTPASLVAEWPDQWAQHLGFGYAIWEVAADAARRAKTLDAAGLVEALAATDLETLAGRVRFGADHVGRTPLVGGQWGPGELFPWELRVVLNETAPSVPVQAGMRPIGAA